MNVLRDNRLPRRNTKGYDGRTLLLDGMEAHSRRVRRLRRTLRQCKESRRRRGRL